MCSELQRKMYGKGSPINLETTIADLIKSTFLPPSLSRVNAAHCCCCLDAAFWYWLTMVPYFVSMRPPQQRSRMAKA